MRFNRALAVACILFFAGGARCQSSFTRSGDGNTTSFDDGWLFKRYGLQADGARLEEPQHPEAASFNDRNWQKLSLPHDWAIAGPFRIELAGNTGKLPWKGIGWYRKHFMVSSSDAGKQIFVDFDGAMAYAELWLNGHYVGTWPYGYSSFRMDLTPYVAYGKENVLAVKLNTEKWDSRWYPGAGIYRHVWLVKTDPLHVDHWGTSITTPVVNEASATVNIKVTVVNASDKAADAIVKTAFFEAGKGLALKRKVADADAVKVKIPSNSSDTMDVKVQIGDPRLWSIENPNRYIAVTSIFENGRKTDVYYSTFGIRKLEFTAQNGFLLNGKRVQIQGTCNHGDLGALGVAINNVALKRQLLLLKEMGCNALRTSHNPPAPELLEMADEMGFLVWDEAFDAWKHGKRRNDYNKLFDEWHERDLRAMVDRDRNHPSVFIWSIGNEVMDQRDVAMTRELVDIVHQEDPTRPVSNAYNDPDGGRASGAAASLDIMGVNYFFNQQPKWDKDPRYANKPTIGSETSSCVSSRGEYFFGTEYKNWQVTSYDVARPGWGCTPDEQFRTNARFPNLLGEFVWTGFDYLGEPTPYNSDETNLLNFRTDSSKRAELERKLEELRKNNPLSRSSYFGIIDLAGFPKDRFYLYQSHWRPDLPMAHLLPHWNWEGRKDSIVPVEVYTSGDEAELFLNGKSLGRKKKRGDEDFRLVWDSVVYQPGDLRAVAYKDGKRWATDVVKTTGAAARLKITPDKTVVHADGEDLVFARIAVTDENGLMVPTADNRITCSVAGNGAILATDNGDPTCLIAFSNPVRSAFNGLLLAIIKAKPGAKGELTFTVNSDGLKTDTITLEIK